MEHPGAPARIPLSRLPGPGKGRRRQSLPWGSSTAGTCRERHGTGPPGGLPGRPCRDGTIPFPASRGHAALAPALADGRTTGLSGHGAQVIGLARQRCAEKVIPSCTAGTAGNTTGLFTRKKEGLSMTRGKGPGEMDGVSPTRQQGHSSRHPMPPGDLHCTRGQ